MDTIAHLYIFIYIITPASTPNISERKHRGNHGGVYSGRLMGVSKKLWPPDASQSLGKSKTFEQTSNTRGGTANAVSHWWGAPSR